MDSLKLHIEKVFPFVSEQAIYSLKDDAMKQLQALHTRSGKGNDFLGWINLPSEIDEQVFKQIDAVRESFTGKVEYVVIVGIGGSYLGAKAVIDALSNSFSNYQKNESPHILFAGQNISEDYMAELLDLLDQKSYAVVVISKSGTTTEPALAFRLLKHHLEKQIGKQQAAQRIVAITDKSRGALRQLATLEGYATFTIPDDIGGRFSVFTPVGLIPIALAGFDIRKLVEGAKAMRDATQPSIPFEKNPAAIYAATRNALYQNGKTIEMLVNYNPKLHFVAEWWKQLYGESEGKEHVGIFPASVDFTTDLHSLGQYLQEGLRVIFETVISINQPNKVVAIPSEPADLDKLNFLSGRRIDTVNKMAELGTTIAHIDGGVPNIQIEIERLDEYNIGQLLYFFEISCGISGYILGVNPFDQPGVEAYKKNMFALLEKPGFEEETRKIKARLTD